MPTYHTVKKQMDALRETIAHHEQLYRETLLPVIEDAQFDALVRQLKAMEEKYPQFAEVQLPASDGFAGKRSIAHRVPMLSIHATTQMDAIFDWLQNYQVKHRAFFKAKRSIAIAMPKLDGMALSLFYRNGELVYALTRGRAGSEGHDVTMQAKRLKGIPLRISDLRDVIVRGEVVVNLEAFRRYHLEEANMHYSSPRMAAVGALRSTDGKLSRQMEATFVAYRRMFFDKPTSNVEVETRLPFSAQPIWLANEGFLAIPFKRIEESDLTQRQVLETYLSDYPTMRDGWEYATDGIVFAYEGPEAPKLFGQNEHHPHWMIAYKPPAQTATSVLRRVDFNVSRSGAITPVGIVDPVEILNKQVSSINLHSVGFLKAWGLHVGDQIKIGMVHEVVPQFQGAQVFDSHPPIEIPTHCPSCRRVLQATPSGLACTHRDSCPAQVIDRFVHFAGPKGMSIRGLGPSLIEVLVERGKLRCFSDIYRLTEEDLKNALGGSVRRARSIREAIIESRYTTLQRFLIALGIPGFGPSLVKPLTDHYDRQLVTLLEITDPHVLKATGIVTLGKAKTLIKGLQAAKDDIRTMLDLGITWPIASSTQGNP